MELELFSSAAARSHNLTGEMLELAFTFEEWWERWPRKQGKAAARRRWGLMSAAEKVSAWDALDGWQKYAASEGTKFVPYGSSWLNQSRWEDEPPQTTEPRSRLKGRTGLESALMNMKAQDERKELEQ